MGLDELDGVDKQVMPETTSVMGYDAKAYSQRQEGYSPDPIRQAAWGLVKGEIGGQILDAGSGGGGWLTYLQQNGAHFDRIISTDIFDYGVSQLPGVEFHLLDLSYAQLPCDDGQLDWISALEVIEHLANPRNFVREAARGLKKGGRLLISTPSNDCLRAKLYFLFKNHFPAFRDHDYRLAGHITPILELDLIRMAQETGFEKAEFFYPLSGRIPKTTVEWASVFPFLKGRAYADTMFAILTR